MRKVLRTCTNWPLKPLRLHVEMIWGRVEGNIHKYICICIYIYVHVCIHTYTSIYMYIYMGLFLGLRGFGANHTTQKKSEFVIFQWIHRVGGIVCQGTQDAKRFPDFELQHSILVQLYGYR